MYIITYLDKKTSSTINNSVNAPKKLKTYVKHDIIKRLLVVNIKTN